MDADADAEADGHERRHTCGFTGIILRRANTSLHAVVFRSEPTAAVSVKRLL